MEYEALLQINSVALLEYKSETKHEYVVVRGYDPTQPTGNQWENGSYFTLPKGDPKKCAELMSKSLDLFLGWANKSYISRLRLEEIATKTVHELKEIDEETVHDFLEQELYLESYEHEFFGLND